MPFDPSSPLGTEPVTLGIGKNEAPPPSFVETLNAAYQTENLIGSTLASQRASMPEREFSRIDPSYNVFDDIQGYEDYADRFERAYNPTAAGAIKADIDREIKNRKTLAASGWTGIGLSMAAGVFDPTILIPAGAMVKSGMAGASVIRSGASVAMGAGAGVAVQEAGLQATQETRTAAESALNIGGTVILGGIIGAAGAKFISNAEWGRVGKIIEEDLAGEIPDPKATADTIVTRMQSAGAAAAQDLKLDDLGVGGPRAAQAVAKATEFLRINPGVQTMFSPSLKVRETYSQLVDNAVYTKMNMEGKTTGPSVENLVKEYSRGRFASWSDANRSHYKQAKKAGFEGGLDEFNIRVAQAGRRNDVDPGGNEFVTKAAQEARSKIFDPLLERAIRNGQLPEDVKTTTAASYVTRMWNRQMLIGREQDFRKVAGDYFRGEMRKIPEADRPGFVSQADMDDYIEDIVTSVFNNLTGRGRGDMPEWIVPATRGPLKERTFNIPDEMVEEFLENDMELVLRRYTRVMGAEVELHEKFGRADMRDQIEAIGKEYDDLSKKAKSDNERAKLDAARKRDIQNLEAFRDLVRGTYRSADEASNWSQITRAALAWNYIRLLGGVTLTSMADMMRLVGVHGVVPAMTEALPALVSNVKAAKISRLDAKELGAVTERVLQSRLASLAELQDPYRYGSAFDRYLSNATNIFTKATGLGWWNDTMKTAASVMTQNRMAKNAMNWEKASGREKAYMAFLGIDEDMAGRVAKQLDKYGEKDGGIWGANVSKWDDEAARRAWGAALNKDVDRTIVTKGVADQPLWTRTNAGRLIMQFKSFGLASHQRVLIAGLQERPSAFASQMVMGTALGMMISYLKFIERGDVERANNLLENPGLWISDGLDRTGLLSIPFDVSNTADKLSASYGGPNIGITAAASALAGDNSVSGGVSRYASRNATGAVLGPSVGLFEDMANIISGIAKGDLNKGQANAIIRQVPGATLPGVRSAIHMGVKPALHEAVE